MASVQDLLAGKGFAVHTVNPCMTALEATELMNDRKIGAVVVMEEGRVVGMFTERDVMRRIVAGHRDPNFTYVGEVMTHEIICVPPNADLDEVSMVMKTRRVRHLPVVSEDGDLLGLVSLGDLNAFYAGNQANQIEWLSEYVFGRA